MKNIFLGFMTWLAVTYAVNAQSQTTMCNINFDAGVAATRGWDENIASSACGSTIAADAINFYGMQNFSGDSCNANSNGGRMLNALWVLRHAYPNYSYSNTFANSGILKWAFRFGGDSTDILEPTCKSNTHFEKKNSGFPFYRNTYYMRFNGDWLFNGNVVERASVIVHEARHRQVVHASDSVCPRGGSCDDRLDGSNFYQLVWLEWFAVSSDSRFTDDMRQRAFDAATYLGNSAFSFPVPLSIRHANTVARPIMLMAKHDQPNISGIQRPEHFCTATYINIGQSCNGESWCAESFGRACTSAGGTTVSLGGSFACRQSLTCPNS